MSSEWYQLIDRQRRRELSLARASGWCLSLACPPRRTGWYVLCIPLLMGISGCPFELPGGEAINPFVDLPPIELDGRTHVLDYTIAPLGLLAEGQVIRLKVDGAGAEAVLLLAEDEEFAEAGVLAGGGPPNEFFQYRARTSGRYYVFVMFKPGISAYLQKATLTAAPGDPEFQPPARQAVLVVFEEDFLTDPGLVDPDSFTEQEKQVLSDITATVREGIIARLRSIFADAPMEIYTEDDPLPDGPVSRVTFSPRRELVRDEDIYFDTIISPLDAEHADCTDRVIFGEVLPRGAMVDPGNSIPDDEAVVYVGSFQGRGLNCRTAAINSANNIIFGLAHTAAHEIGHLVGLYHVALTDIMDRSPTQAFQRALSFSRGQMLKETPTGGEVLTTVIQDPDFYFQAAFGG